jgi:hypothetical protein
MADYKFDGRELREKGSKIGVLNGNNVCDAHGSKVGTLDGKCIRDSYGSKVAEFDGNDVRDSHGSKIATIDGIKKNVDGIGGTSLVAMWLFFIR